MFTVHGGLNIIQQVLIWVGMGVFASPIQGIAVGNFLKLKCPWAHVDG